LLQRSLEGFKTLNYFFLKENKYFHSQELWESLFCSSDAPSQKLQLNFVQSFCFSELFELLPFCSFCSLLCMLLPSIASLICKS